MARKKSGDGGGGPNWLDTYADMVTLLLTFFVLLFAMSSMDSGKWQMLVKAFAQTGATAAATQQLVMNSSSGAPALESAVVAAGGSGTTGLDSSSTATKRDMTFDDLYHYIKSYVDQNGLSNSVSVNKGDGYTFIVFQNSIFFNGDSSILRDDGKIILNYLCAGLAKVSDQIQEVRFYGHTARVDNEQTPEKLAFDRKLSSDRATNVLLYVQYKNIIDPKKMVSEGYGEYRPLVPHDGTEATRIKNRRVEILISKEGSVSKTLDQVYSEIKNSGKASISSSKP
jgi:chemotaxis protein MotB